MHIAGGLYHELCCIPEWDAMWGSGARAAAALSTLSPGSILHTYSENYYSESVSILKRLHVDVKISPRPTSIVFAYFHPLSNPHIEPQIDKITQQLSIEIKGIAVLRFGFLEGDAIVTADRAVYDPQTWKNPAAFGANGSTAQELAIVLNELELYSMTSLKSLDAAAALLMDRDGASVIVVKRGIRGANVYERDGSVTTICAYRSAKVFKIGTGDVFSAVFAHYWAEKKIGPNEAAHIASRCVAAYCDGAGKLPIVIDDYLNYLPVKFSSVGSVLLLGSTSTLGKRYTIEEAKFSLTEFGFKVFNPTLDQQCFSKPSAILIIADGFDSQDTKTYIESAKVNETPIVVFLEGSTQVTDFLFRECPTTITDDFASAIYFVAWAASEPL